ncbi:hypothetical protein LB505_006020 [Fusarium chuoi]|nr:hypothetical protein LB505_006020 [Fusarium chuoi]
MSEKECVNVESPQCPSLWVARDAPNGEHRRWDLGKLSAYCPSSAGHWTCRGIQLQKGIFVSLRQHWLSYLRAVLSVAMLQQCFR